MLELQQHTGKLKCENYGLFEFLLDVQNGVNQGYELDDSNEGFPQVYGSLYTCLLKPKVKLEVEQPKEPQVVITEETVVTQVETEVKPEDVLVIAPHISHTQQQNKRGPKPKN